MTGKSGQMPFDLGHRTLYAAADFRAAPCNKDALAWIGEWPRWPAPALVLHGPAASGKTHLAHVWREKAGAEVFEGDMRDDSGAVVVDDADRRFIGDAAREEALFHLYNRMKEKGGHILLTASAPPGEWRFVLPDLKSRVLSCSAVALHPPDDELIAIVLSKMFSDRQIFVPQEVIAFALPRMERSFSAARALAGAVDRKALAEKRPVTVPLVREVMQALAED